MSLRGEPLERDAVLPDGRVLRVRVGVPEDSYIPRDQLDTVDLELWDEAQGEHVAAVTTVLEPEQTSEGLRLLEAVVLGLESGELQPTAGALEPLADRVL
ncbi:MAG: hypothetical protein JOZ56_11515 [Actinobacteria bacterium]|nr:hypothetical protein [Actinomycetota bacterium]MBV8563710.1 hypothetical protein [Actinomycetota bacterium]